MISHPYVFGRPREWDRAKVAQDLVEWSKLDTSINLCEFCGMHMMQATKITDWAREDEHFRAAYHIAKHNIGSRREVKLSKGELHQKAYDLNAKTYDHFLKEETREQIAYEASLKVEKPEDQEKTREAVSALKEFTQVITSERALKRAEKSKRAESKSQLEAGADKAP